MKFSRWEVNRSDILSIVDSMPKRQHKEMTRSPHVAELELLDNGVAADEPIVALTYGYSINDGDVGVLAATSRRLFFVSKFGDYKNIKKWPYPEIQSWGGNYPFLGGTELSFTCPDGPLQFRIGHEKEQPWNRDFIQTVGKLIEKEAFA